MVTPSGQPLTVLRDITEHLINSYMSDIRHHNDSGMKKWNAQSVDRYLSKVKSKDAVYIYIFYYHHNMRL